MTDKERKAADDKKYAASPKGIAQKRSRKGMTAILYGNMRQSSKGRDMCMPDFDLTEFREWIYAQPNFETLYNNWTDSDYDRWARPSPDRIKEDLPYTFSNLKLGTWKDNHDNQMKERLKNGGGSITFDGTYWVAYAVVNQKKKHIKQSKDKQKVMNALEEYRRENR